MTHFSKAALLMCLTFLSEYCLSKYMRCLGICVIENKKIPLDETLTDFSFWGSKMTADGDCSHEIKRRLLLGIKVMTNLDSILKSRDITSSTKVCLLKAVVFPVVMYGCDSWTIKKAEI